MSWCFNDEQDQSTMRVLDSLQESQAVVRLSGLSRLQMCCWLLKGASG